MVTFVASLTSENFHESMQYVTLSSMPVTNCQQPISYSIYHTKQFEIDFEGIFHQSTQAF